MGLRFRKTLTLMLGAFALAVSYTQCAPPGSQTLNTSSGNSLVDARNPNNPGSAASQNYFATKVLPVFESQCVMCHNEPRFGGNGPLTIYNYIQMRVKLASGGESALNNDLINKVQGLITHFGNNQCSTNGINAPPCSTIRDWWEFEFKTTSSGITGRVEQVSPIGEVIGWALDTRTPTQTFNVHVYIGGAVGVGTLVGQYPANQPGLGGQGAGHYFIFTLPDQYRNGQLRDLYVYGQTAVAANILQGAPKRFAAYLPRAAGQTYYNNTVRPALQSSCGACHGAPDYIADYVRMLNPTPAEGATSSTNRLVQKPSAQVTHGGGNVCGGANNGACALIQEWWRREFL